MQPTRRQALLGIGAVGIGTTGTILSIDEAQAVSVSMGAMNLEDGEHAGEISEIIADVDVEVQYEANNIPDEIVLTMDAGEAQAMLTEVSTTTIDGIETTQGTTETTITGNILESSSLSVASFELLPGQPMANVDVEVEIIAELFRSGSAIAEGRVTDTATVTRHRDTSKIEIAANGTLTIN